MSITFNQIPLNLRVNAIKVELSNELANQGPVLFPVNPLIIGQQLSTGTYTEGTVVNVQNADQVGQKAGFGSHLHLMAKAYFANNKTNNLSVLPVDDNGTSKSEGLIEVTALNAQAGSIFLYIGGQLVLIPVNKDDAANDIAASINTAINAQINLPVVATVLTNTVTVEAKNAGTLGNSIDIRLNYFDRQELPSGVSLAITSMSGGATDPLISTLLPTSEIWYNYIAQPYTDSVNLAALSDWANTRADASLMLDATVFMAKADTYNNLVTLGNSINNEWLVIAENYKSASTDFELSAALMGLFSSTQNLRVGSRVVPFQNRRVLGILPAKAEDKFSETDRNNLLYNGISTSKTRLNNFITDQLITTYSLNNSGNTDWSYLYPETLEGLRFIRWDVVQYLGSKYPNRVIGDSGVKYSPGNTDVVTVDSLKNDLIGRAYSYWAKNNIIVDPKGFGDSLIMEINEVNPNRIDFLMVPVISKGLRQMAGKIAFK